MIVLGSTDHDQLVIVIDGRAPGGVRRDTLLHELLHVVTEITGLHFKWGDERDEEIVRRLSPILLELLRRNPDAVAYLMDNDQDDTGLDVEVVIDVDTCEFDKAMRTAIDTCAAWQRTHPVTVTM